ncbi:MAG: ribosome maturation factor RimM [Clostridia bacterium]|jgi:16S rRNA processing protein RimM
MDYLKIGYIKKPQGMKGEIKVEPLTNDINRFYDLDWVYIRDSTMGIRRISIRGVRVHKDHVYLYLEGVANRDQAEQLRNQYLWIDREHAVKLPEGFYYTCDIIGCQAYDPKGVLLGEVVDVLQTGSNDVYVIEGNDNEILVPALHAVVKKIDIQEKRIQIDMSQLEEVEVREL